jgi:hypothetical protein
MAGGLGTPFLTSLCLHGFLGTDGDSYTHGGRFAGKRCAEKIHYCSIRKSECEMADD